MAPRRAETRKPSLAGCLVAAFRLGLPHSAARALALVGPLLGLGVWLSMVGLTEKPGGTADGWLLLWRLLITAVACLPGLLLWPFTATIHAFLASGKTRILGGPRRVFPPARRRHRQERRRDADARRPAAAARIVNLLLLVEVGLWVLDGLAGLDAAFVGLQLSIANPVYDLALVLFAWLLLAPFFEASNFLLHVDARSRHEGLDLQVRVQRVFPTAERRRVGALAVLVGLLWLAAPARADTTYDAVHAARQDVQTVRRKAEAAGSRTAAPAGRTALRSDGRPPGASGRPRTVRLVSQSDRRLRRPDRRTTPSACWTIWTSVSPSWRKRCRTATGLDQTTPSDDFKKLLQQSGGRRPAVQPEDDTDQKKADDEKDKKDDDKKDDKKDEPDDQHGHPALMGPGAVPGCGQVGLMLAAGLALAVLLVGAVMFIAARKKGPAAARKPMVPAKSVQQTTERHEPLPIERPAAEWQREADELARKEEYLQAVRTLYLAVLSLLHRRQLLRFEPTRTNGEYVQQVRLAPQAPPALHAVFGEFTRLFERKWYGDRACEAAEFRAARKLAEEIQAVVREI